MDVTFQNMGVMISGYLSQPKVSGVYPAVLILHGTEGYLEHHKEYARDLASNGYVALAICWFGCSGGRGTYNDIELGDIEATVDYLKSQASVDAGRIGVVGFSRGSSLAIASACSISDFRAVVDYYGAARISDSFTKIIQASPTGQSYDIKSLNGPMLILHGSDDPTVNVGAAYSLEKQMKKYGKSYEMKVYSGVGHAFNWVDGHGVYNADAEGDAWSRTVGFFDNYLWGGVLGE